MCPFVFAYRLQALSSLSRPIVRCSSIKMTSPDFGRPDSGLVGLDGLEPSTSRLSGARSSHLSYRPVFLSGFSVRPSLKVLPLMVEMKGFEPLTPCLQGRCSPNWATPPFSGLYLRTLIESWQLNNKSLKYLALYTSTKVFVLIWLRVLDCFPHSALTVSIERRWSSRTFRYGYLVTT